MSSNNEIYSALQELVGEILQAFDHKVSETGPFPDLRVKQQLYYGDPAVNQPGMLELTVMNMDQQINPQHSSTRFLALRVKKSPRGGTVSATCFHGTKSELRAELEREQKDPTILAERVQELASGLPEETNPNLWR